MFKNKERTQEQVLERTKLDELIENLEKKLENMDPTDKDYETVVQNLKRFAELKSYRESAELDNEKKRKQLDGEIMRIDPNIALQVGGFLIGTILCIHAEMTGTITTKAFSWLPRMIGGLRRV